PFHSGHISGLSQATAHSTQATSPDSHRPQPIPLRPHLRTLTGHSPFHSGHISGLSQATAHSTQVTSPDSHRFKVRASQGRTTPAAHLYSSGAFVLSIMIFMMPPCLSQD
ncbi:hypothetical protein Bpfe_002016, partial [Biomphalaria pfeifferi]